MKVVRGILISILTILFIVLVEMVTANATWWSYTGYTTNTEGVIMGMERHMDENQVYSIQEQRKILQGLINDYYVGG